MNLRIVARLLGIVSLLISGFMVFSLPWAFPALGVRHAANFSSRAFEKAGFVALVAGICIFDSLSRRCS